ncbi:MAG: acyltransferase family protein [Bdellovibrionales bacterium]|nr:acyltransferase family protein [Bdellovibrionales bacterium]
MAKSRLRPFIAEFLRNYSSSQLGIDLEDRIHRAIPELNASGYDPWGLDPKTVHLAASFFSILYRHYFRVEVEGTENVPAGRAMLIGNHGGQIPLDGVMIAMSMLIDANPPRIVRAMVERWVPVVPFVSTFFIRVGEIIGHPKNCRELLNKDHPVLVFPEGVKGSGKLYKDRYQLQKFGTGFMRLALETKSPIVPVAVIGSEETYPGILDLKPLANLIGAPYFPVTPLFPWLGVLGMIPVPAKITIRYGKPMHFDLASDAPEPEIRKAVDKVKHSLQFEIDEGLRIRGNSIFTKAAK